MVGVGCMESHPEEHHHQIFQEVLHKAMLWTDPKMTFYGKTMVKIKMMVTDNNSVMSDDGESDD
jgi:hypothetical protein